MKVTFPMDGLSQSLGFPLSQNTVSFKIPSGNWLIISVHGMKIANDCGLFTVLSLTSKRTDSQLVASDLDRNRSLIKTPESDCNLTKSNITI